MEKRHPPRSLSHDIFLEVPPSEVWSLITQPGHLEKVHPYCKSNEVVKWDLDGCEDILLYSSGRRFVRRIEPWIEGIGYNLWIGEEGGPQSYVEWRIEPTNNGYCHLRIRIYPYLLSRWPSLLAALPFKFWVHRRLMNYLEAVLSGIKFHLKTGKSVPRDQPNSHPWFSA